MELVWFKTNATYGFEFYIMKLIEWYLNLTISYVTEVVACNDVPRMTQYNGSDVTSYYSLPSCQVIAIQISQKEFTNEKYIVKRYKIRSLELEVIC